MTKVRTWVGLDVHAAAAVACVVDAESGELSVQRLAGRTSEVAGFCARLPAAVRAAYEAGPTGFELARALLGLNQVDAAEKSAVEARTQKPELAQLHLVLANIHMRKRNYPALLLDIDAYLKIEPAGPMSDQARAMREKLQQGLANAQSAPGTSSPKP